MRPRSLGLTLAALTLPLAAVGCVPQDRYDNLLTANRSLKEQLTSATGQRDQTASRLELAERELAQFRSAYGSLEGQYQDLSSSVAGLNQSNEEYLRRIANMEIGPLPPEVNNALAGLANAYPDLLAFNASMGMLEFSSDFTFDLGSTSLKPEARQLITRLAGVLNAYDGQSLEARIVGHTDNVPIRKPETKRNHPTNTHLSVHRAIAVRDALSDAGVDPVRMQVAGYGPYRPVVAASGAAAENRRVEIFLATMPPLDMRASSYEPETTSLPAPSVSTGAEPERPRPMK